MDTNIQAVLTILEYLVLCWKIFLCQEILGLHLNDYHIQTINCHIKRIWEKYCV